MLKTCAICRVVSSRHLNIIAVPFTCACANLYFPLFQRVFSPIRHRRASRRCPLYSSCIPRRTTRPICNANQSVRRTIIVRFALAEKDTPGDSFASASDGLNILRRFDHRPTTRRTPVSLSTCCVNRRVHGTTVCVLYLIDDIHEHSRFCRHVTSLRWRLPTYNRGTAVLNEKISQFPLEIVMKVINLLHRQEETNPRKVLSCLVYDLVLFAPTVRLVLKKSRGGKNVHQSGSTAKRR